MAQVTLILGGVRSGKSGYALELADAAHGKKTFIATAEGLDQEMKERIARHRSERDPSWKTIEEPLRLPDVLKEADKEGGVVLIDCLTLWVSNVLHAGLDCEREFAALVTTLGDCGNADIYVVSNEVGMGVVPEHPLGRVYRDQLGLLNKMAARAADRVVLMVAGIPLDIKGGKSHAGW